MSFASRTPLINTLRARLAAWYLAVIGVALVLFTVLLYVILTRSLQDHHDEDLRREATNLAAALVSKPITAAGVTAALEGSSAASQLVMLRDSRGELLYRSPVLQSSEPNIGRHEALVHAAAHGSQSAEFFTADLERSGPVRFICVPLPRQPGVYLQLGNPLGDTQALLRDVLTACLISIPVVLVVTSLGGWVMARRALRPLRTIDAKLQDIQATDLSRRIDVYPADGELASLVTTVNGLLDRLDRSFVSLRQFAADVSHELQTPLTVMKSAIEHARSRAPVERESRVIEDLAEEITNMSAVITSLRTLALADASLPKERTEPVNLSAITAEVAELISALGETHGVSVTASIEPDVTVRGDSVRLKQVLLNLGDNAVKYTPTGGHVAVDLTSGVNEAVIRVTDTGSGIPAAHLPHIFDRFYRIESSRGGAEGTGLGLAIVKRIVEVHGGTIEVDSVEGRGSRFTVRLPRVSPPGPGSD